MERQSSVRVYLWMGLIGLMMTGGGLIALSSVMSAASLQFAVNGVALNLGVLLFGYFTLVEHTHRATLPAATFSMKRLECHGEQRES